MYFSSVGPAPTDLFQNLQMPTPKEIADRLVLLEIKHFDFQGRLQSGQIIIHELISEDVAAFFIKAYNLRFPIHSVRPVNEFGWYDHRSCSANNSSGHNMRHLRTGKMSKHGIGCAFDINPRQNPCFDLDGKNPSLPLIEKIPSEGMYEPGTPGTLQKGDVLVELMTERGWAWGGNWTFPKDYQHFQIVPPELKSYVG